MVTIELVVLLGMILIGSVAFASRADNDAYASLL